MRCSHSSRFTITEFALTELEYTYEGGRFSDSQKSGEVRDKIKFTCHLCGHCVEVNRYSNKLPLYVMEALSKLQLD